MRRRCGGWRQPEGGGARPDPRRLWRNPDDRIVSGLCAGIADYLGIRPWVVRAGTVLALIPFFPQVVLAYLVASVLIRTRPAGLFRSQEEEVFWRSVVSDAPSTLAALRDHFAALEDRLIGLERYVTSPEFELRRRFRDIDPGQPGGPDRDPGR